MVGIYRIYNLITGQSYIGQSIDIDDRMRRHFACARRGLFDRCTTMVDIAIHHFGIDNFGYEILEHCSTEELAAIDDYYIN